MLRNLADAMGEPMALEDAPPFAPAESYANDLEPEPPATAAIMAKPYQWRAPENLPRRPWLYGRQLLRGSVFVVVAPGATGKTSWTIGTALALITGRDLLGEEVWEGSKRVWLWNLEDPESELAYSIQAAALHWGVSHEELEGRLFVNSGPDGSALRLAMPSPTGTRIDSAVAHAVETELRNREIDVLVIDPFVSSHGLADENDNAAIDRVAKEWARIAATTGCAVILVHHARKLNGSEVTVESARGASSLTDAARGGLALNRMTEADAQEFGIDPANRRRFFRADDAKPNRAPAGEARWFEMVSVHLGNEPDGGLGDSVGVAVPWKAPDPFDDVSIADLRAVQSRIDERGWRESPQATDWFGHLIADVLGLDLDEDNDKRKVRTIAKTWIKNGAFVIVEREDDKRRPRKFVALGKPA